jgi:SAM-dependent methyltransferase
MARIIGDHLEISDDRPSDGRRPPLCPITGLPAKRLVQNVSSALLMALWRVPLGVRTERQLAGVKRFGLWESPCGLIFFDPMIAGDKEFYKSLYAGVGSAGPWQSEPSARSDFAAASRLIAPGEKVLDVGCGTAGFADYIPQASYVGIDSFATGRTARVQHESIADHADAHPEEYDTVSSFHFIEHIDAPARLVADAMRCLRPGGRLCLAAPSWPSALTAIPNFPFNAPPHHLSWWNERALAQLAGSSGLIIESIERLPPSPFSSLIYWMGRAAPKLTGEVFFRHSWRWHFALLLSWLAGSAGDRLFALPKKAHSFEILLVARKPG